MTHFRLLGTALLGAATLTLPSISSATFTVVAADTQTKAVGGVGASCIGITNASIGGGRNLGELIFDDVPGKGAVAVQYSLSNPNQFSAIKSALEAGVHPTDIVSTVVSPSFSSAFSNRQYGMVNTFGQADGSTCNALANHDDLQVTGGRFAISVQGNGLTSLNALSLLRDGFQGSGLSCDDLPERLMAAYMNAIAHGEGDARCPSLGDSVFLKVDLPDGSNVLDLRVDCSSVANCTPTADLQTAFAAWRSTHGCLDSTPVPDSGSTPVISMEPKDYCGDNFLEISASRATAHAAEIVKLDTKVWRNGNILRDARRFDLKVYRPNGTIFHRRRSLINCPLDYSVDYRVRSHLRDSDLGEHTAVVEMYSRNKSTRRWELAGSSTTKFYVTR